MSGRIQKKPEENMSKLSGKQFTAVVALATGKLKKEAAEAANVSPQIVSEWLRQPLFRSTLDSIREQLVEQVSSELQALARESIVVLKDILRSGHPALQLRASMYVLDRVIAIRRGPMTLDESEQFNDEEASRVLQSLGVTHGHR